ncbi:autotransporter secretion outer membrane protein TamA [Desulfuromonas soudanensis]|uniref:Translocation and assembly module subunit TamA n=1 Tax=Desulfuromonas soudanensis TaxID=1603606 RepID=A0A0M3QFF4_9BACT|nr:autotransporter assembly complex family protein [Desulfuromonas soudanensis]ALC15973.1 autotransporter secretion outer membrane protein TamA [Desulfuromonas soudanensis]
MKYPFPHMQSFLRSSIGNFWNRLGLLTALLLLLLAATTLAADPLEIAVTGVEEAALDNVRAALVLPPDLVRDGRVEPLWLERFVRQVPERVRRALEPYGFYEAEVSTDLQVRGENDYLLTVAVVPGEPVRLTTVRVRLSGPGENEPRLQSLVGDFPLLPGEVLRQDLYDRARGTLKARALDLGYLDADFAVHRILLNRQERRAEIDLELATGERYLFGEVLMHGAPDYPERFLRRYIAFAEGDVFSYPRLGQTQLNFLDSDRFREVIITPRLDLTRDLRVPINLKLVSSPRRRLRPGIGYGTDTGARMSVNYRDLNVLRRGHEFSADLGISEHRQSLTSSYILPGLKNMDSQTALRAGFERESISTFETRSLFAEIERLHGFGRGRIGSVYLRLLQEDYIVGLQDSRSRLILPGLRFSHRSYADPIRPKRGFRYSLEGRGTHQSLGSDTGLLQFLAGGNAVVPLPWQLKLLLRTQGGTTLKNEPLSEVPASLRFFAGGDQSVRGYGYQTVGPRDASGKVIGGEHLAVGSVELEVPIGENWGVAAFFDLGSAFNSVTEIDWARGAGLGVRRYTMVGPVKIDIARQIGVADPSYRVHVSVGFGW